MRCACGKLSFPTKAAAEKRYPKQRAYLCPFGTYHVASKVSRRQR